MIYASGCPQCKVMRETIAESINLNNVDVDLREYDCEDADAIDVALEYGIEDIPGCCIDGVVVEGEGFSPSEIKALISKL